MSALGQKQTFALHQPMSALPPIATAKADIRKPPCLLYPQERTCAVSGPCLLWAKSGLCEDYSGLGAVGRIDAPSLPQRPSVGLTGGPACPTGLPFQSTLL